MAKSALSFSLFSAVWSTVGGSRYRKLPTFRSPSPLYQLPGLVSSHLQQAQHFGGMSTVYDPAKSETLLLFTPRLTMTLPCRRGFNIKPFSGTVERVPLDRWTKEMGTFDFRSWGELFPTHKNAQNFSVQHAQFKTQLKSWDLKWNHSSQWGLAGWILER